MDPSFMLTPKPSPLGLLGFRFLPTDQEILLVHFHQMVVAKQPLSSPLDRVIRRCDVFGNKSEPSAIWNHFGGDEIYDLNGSLYFLSKLTKNGSRIDRKIARGTWSETESYRDVPRFDPNDSNCPGEIGSSNNPVIGKKRKFRYENPSEDITEDHTAWLLDEYSLIDAEGGGDADQKDSSENKYDFDYVICRLRRNGRTQISENETVQNSDKKRKRLPTEAKIKAANKRVKKDQSKEKKMIKPRNKRGKKDESKATNENVGKDEPTCSSPEKMVQARNEIVKTDEPTCSGTTASLISNPGDAYILEESNTSTTMDDIWAAVADNDHHVMNDYHPELFDASNTATMEDIWAADAYGYQQPAPIAIVDGDQSIALDQLAQNNYRNEYVMNQLLDCDQSTAADAYGCYQPAFDGDQSVALVDQLAQNNCWNAYAMNQLLDTTNYGKTMEHELMMGLY